MKRIEIQPGERSVENLSVAIIELGNPTILASLSAETAGGRQTFFYRYTTPILRVSIIGFGRRWLQFESLVSTPEHPSYPTRVKSLLFSEDPVAMMANMPNLTKATLPSTLEVPASPLEKDTLGYEQKDSEIMAKISAAWEIYSEAANGQTVERAMAYGFPISFIEKLARANAAGS